jgi:hypothetical protein
VASKDEKLAESITWVGVAPQYSLGTVLHAGQAFLDKESSLSKKSLSGVQDGPQRILRSFHIKSAATWKWPSQILMIFCSIVRVYKKTKESRISSFLDLWWLRYEPLKFLASRPTYRMESVLTFFF